MFSLIYDENPDHEVEVLIPNRAISKEEISILDKKFRAALGLLLASCQYPYP